LNVFPYEIGHVRKQSVIESLHTQSDYGSPNNDFSRKNRRL